MNQVGQERLIMKRMLTDVWWIALLRGIFAVIFGLIALGYPGKTILLLVQIMGIFWFINGIFIVIAAIFGRIYAVKWWVLLLRGLLDILIGAVVLSHPLISAKVTVGLLVYIFAFVALAAGIMEIVMAIRARKEIEHKWSVIFGGVFSCLFGLLLLSRPLMSAAVLMIIIGGVAVIFGVSWIVFALNLRKEAKAIEV